MNGGTQDTAETKNLVTQTLGQTNGQYTPPSTHFIMLGGWGGVGAQGLYHHLGELVKAKTA